jgi:hypothetical protein
MNHSAIEMLCRYHWGSVGLLVAERGFANRPLEWWARPSRSIVKADNLPPKETAQPPPISTTRHRASDLGRLSEPKRSIVYPGVDQSASVLSPRKPALDGRLDNGFQRPTESGQRRCSLSLRGRLLLLLNNSDSRSCRSFGFLASPSALICNASASTGAPVVALLRLCGLLFLYGRHPSGLSHALEFRVIGGSPRPGCLAYAEAMARSA